MEIKKTVEVLWEMVVNIFSIQKANKDYLPL
jgi:hypothetical protein